MMMKANLWTPLFSLFLIWLMSLESRYVKMNHDLKEVIHLEAYA